MVQMSIFRFLPAGKAGCMETVPGVGPTEGARLPGGKREFKPSTPVRIYTARYSNRNILRRGLVPVRITRGYPRFPLPYKPVSLMSLAPQGHMLKMAEPEFHRAFGEQLAAIDPDQLVAEMSKMVSDEMAVGVVLLCFEDLRKPGLYCHRTQVARWLEATFEGLKVEELPEE